MKKSDDNKIPKKLTYENLPSDIEAIVDDERGVIRKEVRISFDGNQFVVRFPKDIAEFIEIKKTDKILFELILPKPKTKEEPKLTMELIQSG